MANKENEGTKKPFSGLMNDIKKQPALAAGIGVGILVVVFYIYKTGNAKKASSSSSSSPSLDSVTGEELSSIAGIPYEYQNVTTQPQQQQPQPTTSTTTTAQTATTRLRGTGNKGYDNSALGLPFWQLSGAAFPKGTNGLIQDPNNGEVVPYGANIQIVQPADNQGTVIVSYNGIQGEMHKWDINQTDTTGQGTGGILSHQSSLLDSAYQENGLYHESYGFI